MTQLIYKVGLASLYDRRLATTRLLLPPERPDHRRESSQDPGAQTSTIELSA
jgi:hypothetical protein